MLASGCAGRQIVQSAVPHPIGAQTTLRSISRSVAVSVSTASW